MRRNTTGVWLVVGLISVGLAVTWFAVLGPVLEEERENRAWYYVKHLTIAADAFKAKHGSYPAALSELTSAPVPRPPEPGELIDPWGRPYQYDPSGPKNEGKRPDIWAVTPSGEVIRNWPGR
jgi:hypothetical protein